ncbi:MAG: membrane protein insertion efficiency factor YidD [Magnetococcales bacterium]|nr:membrane protein insertion efficiency factor YidD [Magnetococcales bacterium]MBF0151515.1 membrane protein insertion efficiency factor YidD [Magnetococcales bacterium]MBF0631734.1 membrane protein insertion efficiency factor YidD [Magnetococcales bacterium]
MKINGIILVFLAMTSFFCPLADGEENPLAFRPLSAASSDHASGMNGLTQALLFSLSFYSSTVGMVDGNRCPSFPSCSLYARAALRRHGLIPGIWLTVDRLIHERDELGRHDLVRLHDGSIRVPDTLDENDFWYFTPTPKIQVGPNRNNGWVGRTGP